MLKFQHDMREKYKDPDLSKRIAEYFDSKQKLEKYRAGISFIKRCLNENKMPNFSRVNLANDNLNTNYLFINNLRRQITTMELNNKNKEKAILQKRLHLLNNDLPFDLQHDDWLRLDALTQEKIEQVKEELRNAHNNKLVGLGILPAGNKTFVNTKRRGIDKKEAIMNVNPIFNLSDRKLTEIEQHVLSKGLKYGIKSNRIDTFEIMARFEILAQSLNELPIANTGSELKANLNSKNNFLRQLQQMSDEFIELSKKAYDNLSDEEREALIELAKDKSIVISKADKGNAVVIQNIDDYKRKVSDLLKSDKKFIKLESNPTMKREKALQNYLRKLAVTTTSQGKKRAFFMPNKVYKDVLPCGSRAGVMYGLPKIHKTDTPLRPIISAVNTYNFKLAKYLDGILKPLIINEYALKDTYDFVNKVSHLNTSTDKYMVSFDVESLFTNVPTQETIDIIIKLAYPKPEIKDFHGLAKQDLRYLLEVCTQRSHFQFNGEFYDQIDGVAMGSPLGPLFANVFMSDFERKHMSMLRKLGINIWLRYVDDIFATTNTRDQAKRVLSFINQHA